MIHIVGFSSLKAVTNNMRVSVDVPIFGITEDK